MLLLCRGMLWRTKRMKGEENMQVVITCSLSLGGIGTDLESACMT